MIMEEIDGSPSNTQKNKYKEKTSKQEKLENKERTLEEGETIREGVKNSGKHTRLGPKGPFYSHLIWPIKY